MAETAQTMTEFTYAPGEKNIVGDRFSPSVIIFWLKTSIAASSTRVQYKAPNTLFGLIPLGASTKTIPLRNIASVDTNTKFNLGSLVWGLFFLFVGFGMFDSNALAAIVCLLIAVANFTNVMSATLTFRDPSGGANDITVSILEKDKLMSLAQEIQTRVFADALFAETRVEIAAMRAHEDDYDEQTRDMLEGLAFACAQYNTFLKGTGETEKSIIITTGVHLAPLQVREVRRILSGDDIHLESLDEGKRVVYLELPDTNATFGFLASVFYQCLFETLVRKADHADGGRLGRDVHCLLDEFANIGKIPNFVRLIATIRSRGISCSIILQTVSQGKSLYKDDWETIAGNCDSWLFLGGNEASTTKTISDRLGDQTIDVIETSETKGTNGSWSRSIRKNARKLLTPTNTAASTPANASTCYEAYHPSSATN